MTHLTFFKINFIYKKQYGLRIELHGYLIACNQLAPLSTLNNLFDKMLQERPALTQLNESR